MPSRRRKYWFWVCTLLGTVHKHRRQDPKTICEVWENLIIVSGYTEKEALRKAKTIGKSQSGDCRGSLRLDGKPAICKFLGIADMGLIHDELGDGAEIIWELKRCTQRKAMSLAKSEALLLSRAKKEKGYVV
jgi:hypothetical protein